MLPPRKLGIWGCIFLCFGARIFLIYPEIPRPVVHPHFLDPIGALVHYLCNKKFVKLGVIFDPVLSQKQLVLWEPTGHIFLRHASYQFVEKLGLDSADPAPVILVDDWFKCWFPPTGVTLLCPLLLLTLEAGVPNAGLTTTGWFNGPPCSRVWSWRLHNPTYCLAKCLG